MHAAARGEEGRAFPSATILLANPWGHPPCWIHARRPEFEPRLTAIPTTNGATEPPRSEFTSSAANSAKR